MKQLFSVLFMLFASSCFAQQRVSDFPEYIELRDEMNSNRNYTHPRVISKNLNTEICNQDKSDAIYLALYIMENMETQYVSQDIFSSIVESLTNYPKSINKNYYSKIYIADNLQVSDIITFRKNSNTTLQIDVYTHNSKNSMVLKINDTKNANQTYLEVVSSTYKNKSHISQEFIRGVWYALWNYQWNNNQTKFIFQNKSEENIYFEITDLLTDYKWIDFCNSSDSIDLFRNFYETKYSKISAQDTLCIVELVQRCLIAGM